ncbi:MAG: hypothetical protein ACQESB_07455 [Elusimicrobiota bacterium]
MSYTLLDETKIGDLLTIGFEMENDEVGFFIASSDVSASCGFKFDEWENFVKAVNDADKKFKNAKK